MKPEDKVICVNSRSTPQLTEGAEYTVKSFEHVTDSDDSSYYLDVITLYEVEGIFTTRRFRHANYP